MNIKISTYQAPPLRVELSNVKVLYSFQCTRSVGIDSYNKKTYSFTTAYLQFYYFIPLDFVVICTVHKNLPFLEIVPTRVHFYHNKPDTFQRAQRENEKKHTHTHMPKAHDRLHDKTINHTQRSWQSCWQVWCIIFALSAFDPRLRGHKTGGFLTTWYHLQWMPAYWRGREGWRKKKKTKNHRTLTEKRFINV